MTTIKVLEHKPKMVEGLPFGIDVFDQCAFGFTLALNKSREYFKEGGEVNTVTVKSVDTGRDVSEFLISIFSSRGNICVVVPANSSPLLVWRA